MNLFQRIINIHVLPGWDPDKKRAFRQVNAFNAIFVLVSVSAVPIAIYLKVLPGIIIQTAAALIYFSGFFLLRNHQVFIARRLSIFTLEFHMFMVSIFAVIPTTIPYIPYYSPIFITFMIYPLVAALFDLSIRNHLIIAFLQILLLQKSDLIISNLNIKVIPIQHHELLYIIVTAYTLLMSSIIIYWVYNENKTVKNLEIMRSKELEFALEELNNQQIKIKQQSEKLEILNATKNKFFSIISHDLKSPFNAILGLSQIMVNKMDKNLPYYKYMVYLNNSAKTTYMLLENLLQWARTQLDKNVFRPKEYPISEIVDKIIEVHNSVAFAKKIKIKNLINKELIIYADLDLISIILRNLINNAIKYSHNNGIIKINAENKKDYTEVCVKDYGIGIPKKSIKNLFRIETKQSMPGTADEKGSGLGLIITKEYVEKHHGKIWVKSSLNNGSTFYFSLPLKQD